MIYQELVFTGMDFFHSNKNCIDILEFLYLFIVCIFFRYRRPTVLRKRKEFILDDDAQLKQVEINAEATGIELHKDSK